MSGRGNVWRYGAFDRPLEHLRAAAATAGGTINDGFVAGVAGGLARYHQQFGVPVDELRMLMPVSVRRPDDPSYGNRFVPVRFVVPATGEVPDRIRRIGAASTSWRHEPALAVADAASMVLDRLPPVAASRLFGLLLSGVDFVTTDVAGFPCPVYLGDACVTRYYALPPTMGAAVNVALLSHASNACIGITADARAVADVALLQACIEAGIDEVAALAPAERRSA
jgi:hypothetical protein